MIYFSLIFVLFRFHACCCCCCFHIHHFFFFKSCDLAGSERIKKSGVKGERLSELQHLNLSLLELGYVETILYSPKNFVQSRIYFKRVSGRVFLGSGIWTKYGAGFGKTRAFHGRQDLTATRIAGTWCGVCLSEIRKVNRSSGKCEF